MNWQDRITVDAKVLVGKPVVKGTRLAVEFIIDLLAAGWTHQQILDNYPHLRQEAHPSLPSLRRRSPPL